ncbi:MAG TPA: DUF1761 domain-containing protein [Candidatus Nanoarchaeia archaeon]|nr:DUF1761 domain-containing protein [Candidatus Nanoarchaeia archaeon]
MVLGVEINYLAVIIVSVVNFFIGFLWYGPVFGKAWIKAMKFTPSDVKKTKEKGMAMPMFIAFITSLITTFVLSTFVGLAGADSIVDGAFIGILVWLGFFLTASIGSMLWESKSASLFYLNTTYDIVRFIIMAAILAAW